MADGNKLFQNTKKGETKELKDSLNSTNQEKRKSAVKKIIALMTLGTNVTSFFTDVIRNCMNTENLELKKLVYLYIINTARSQPEKAILVVNTFCRDAKSANPLIKALAIRTMGCIRVDKVIEHLCGPLELALQDDNAYVRKTAAVCCAKLYAVKPKLVKERGFIKLLRNLISDDNPMVVSNAVAALMEVSEQGKKDVLKITSDMLRKLLTALGECTEWGQVFILDCLAQYIAREDEIHDIIERVVPRLQHANSAVVMSAVKVIMKYLGDLEDKELKKELITQKLPPPLVTLLAEKKPEIQYVALRNINLIVQKEPMILKNQIRHFFCNVDDPIYVKLEKLEIVIALSGQNNIADVLMELQDYAQGVDVEFVRKAVRAIGRCAIKLKRSAEKCIKVLLSLISSSGDYVIQEAIVVIKDIFRKYPNKYENIISKLCSHLESLDEPEAKAAMIWIIGEYSDRIDNSHILLETFLENFLEEPAIVQLQLLSSIVKLFLKRDQDKETEGITTKVLKLCSESSENPDLRDRGFIYWRLLSKDAQAAQQVVLSEKPNISDNTFQLNESILDVLISNISTLASVFHKPPENFIKGGRTPFYLPYGAEDEKSGEENEDEETDDEGEGEEEGEEGEETDEGSEEEYEDEDEEAKTGYYTKRNVVLTTQKGKGLQISASYARRNGRIYMDMLFENHTSKPLVNFLLKFNQINYLGVAQSEVKLKVPKVQPGSSSQYSLKLDESLPMQPKKSKFGEIQMAIQCDVGKFVFIDKVPPYILFQGDGQLDAGGYKKLVQGVPKDDCLSYIVDNPYSTDPTGIKNRLGRHGMFIIAERAKDSFHTIFTSAKLKGKPCTVDMKIAKVIKLTVRCKDADVAALVMKSVILLLQKPKK